MKKGPAYIRELLADLIVEWAAAKPKERYKVRDRFAKRIYKVIKSNK